MANVLIVDDDPLFCLTLSKVVKAAGHEAFSAETLAKGLREAVGGGYDLVFLDVQLPDGNGLDALQEIKSAPSSPEIIIVTATGEAEGAEIAIKSGAWDYIQKPASLGDISLPMVRALQYREEKKKRAPKVILNREGIVGNAPLFRTCLDLVAQAAATEINTLIVGETGTGKERLAWAVHNNSARADSSFVVVDCAALPETLIESLLFGHEKGTFTGAERAREGLIKQADGGTLFLDEVGELNLQIQKAFLRVLQERRLRPVGGSREIRTDFRLVAATNRDLRAMVREGKFREDLYFRLSSLVIDVPPLRERSEDIMDIAVDFVARSCTRWGTETKGFSPDFLECLSNYDWPGNVRELLNTLEGALTVAKGEPTLYSKHLPPNIRIAMAKGKLEEAETERETEREARASNPAEHQRFEGSLKEFRHREMARLEKEYLEELLARTKGDINEVCRISELSRSRLYALMKAYDIPTPVRTRSR